MGTGVAARGLLRHRLGSAALPRPRRGCCCRSSARPMARRSSAATSSCATIPAKAVYRRGISSIACPIAPERYGEMLRMIVKEADATETEAGRRLLGACCALYRTAPSQPQGSPRLQDGAQGDRGAVPISSRAAWQRLSRRAKGPSAQTLALHHLLERQHYKLGHWRFLHRATSITASSSTSTGLRACAGDPGNVAATHRLVKQLVVDGKALP